MTASSGEVMRRALPVGVTPDAVTMEQAAAILLQKDICIGTHPDTGADILVKKGKFGPYYRCEGETASFGKVGEDFEPNVEHAMKRFQMRAERTPPPPSDSALSVPWSMHRCHCCAACLPVAASKFCDSAAAQHDMSCAAQSKYVSIGRLLSVGRWATVVFNS